MLIKERRRDQRHGGIVNRSQFRHETERDQRQEHEKMEPLRQPQTLRDAEFDHQRAQPFPAIKIHILRRINKVETCHPADYSRA